MAVFGGGGSNHAELAYAGLRVVFTIVVGDYLEPRPDEQGE